MKRHRFRGLQCWSKYVVWGAAIAFAAPPLHAIEIANIEVLQNDADNNTTSVDVSIPTGQSTPGISIRAGSNRGDYNIQLGADPLGDASEAVVLTTVTENGRDNTVFPNAGGPGLSYATSAIAFGGGGEYFIPVHATSGGLAGSGSEFNMNVAAAAFPFAEGWLAGHATNDANNGTLVNLNAPAGLVLDNGPYVTGTQQFRNVGGGVSELILPGTHAASAGVLLATGGKNEDNFAMTRVDQDGTYSIFVKDNGSNGASYENDGVAFAFIPFDTPGITSGRVSVGGSGSNGVGVWNKSGDFTLRGEFGTDFEDGQVRLSIPGESPASGTLMVTPEGGYGNNVDNVVSYRADGSDWIIQTRDLPGMGLQNLGFGVPGFSFAFIPFDSAPTAPGAIRTPLDTEQRVLAGNVDVVEFDPDNGNASQSATFVAGQSTMNRGTVNVSNRGDNGIVFDGKRLGVNTGVMMATSSENIRDNTATGSLSGQSVVTVYDNEATGYVVATTLFDGFDPPLEFNSNFSVAHFSYDQGWSAQAGVRTGDGVAEVSTINDVDSRSDGILFVNAYGNTENFATAQPKADGTGWDINVRDNSGVIEENNDNGGNGGNRFNYVYVPYGTNDFVGGTTNPDGSTINGQGDFTLTKIGTGEYRLSIPGVTADDAMLLLNANHTGGSADNNLNYEADGNDFIIRGFNAMIDDVPTAEDTGFNFGVIRFDSEATPVGPRATDLPRVVAANFAIEELNADNDGIGVSFNPTTVGESTGAGWEITSGNRGDYGLSIQGERVRRFEGVVLTSVRENFRDNSLTGGNSGTALTAPNTQFSDAWEVSTHTVDGTNPGEINVDFGAVLIPYGSGFQAEQRFASGSQDTLFVEGVDTRTDGVLVGNANNNDDNFITAEALPDGTGYTVQLSDNSGNPEGGNDMYSYAFLPYSTENLVAGHIGADGALLSGTGEFTLTKETDNAGLYRLSIDGESPDNGVLLLTGHTTIDAESSDNMLTYMADGSDFLIQGWDTNAAAAIFEDTEFQFAFASFSTDLRYVEPTTTVDGDFNNDGMWDCADIDALTAAIAAGSSDLSFDMNGDGVVGIDDITDPAAGWLTVGGANNAAVTGGGAFIAGDANLDGSVDVSDFNIWNGNKFTSESGWCTGDFTANGAVDVSDFNVWNGNKFSSSSANVVPEPNMLTLLLLTGLGLMAAKRRMA